MMVTSCGSGKSNKNAETVTDTVTPAQSLITRLDSVAKSGHYYFGHHDDTAYGHTWKYVDGASDVKGVTGQYPGLMSWDLGLIEVDSANNLDGVPFSFIASEIAKQHARGGVNAISWHTLNPMSGGGSWDVSATPLHNLGEGSAVSDTMKVWIDRAAAFIASLKDSEGNPIPVIFRPWHENSGSWFWWGKDHSTPEEYIELWKMTRAGFDARGIDNVVWAYSPDKDLTREEYFSTYPGDEYVDIIGEDIYPGKHVYTSQAARFIKALSYTDTRKLITLSENGCIPDPEQLVRDNIMWSYWCVWEGEFVLKAAGFNNYSEQYTEKNMLKKAYKSDTVITRKELPDLRNYPLGD